jgi:hypothetical protein
MFETEAAKQPMPPQDWLVLVVGFEVLDIKSRRKEVRA